MRVQLQFEWNIFRVSPVAKQLYVFMIITEFSNHLVGPFFQITTPKESSVSIQELVLSLQMVILIVKSSLNMSSRYM